MKKGHKRLDLPAVLRRGGRPQRGHRHTLDRVFGGDLVAFNTKAGTICTLADLRAEQAEFPHCIPDGIFILHEEGREAR